MTGDMALKREALRHVCCAHGTVSAAIDALEAGDPAAALDLLYGALEGLNEAREEMAVCPTENDLLRAGALPCDAKEGTWPVSPPGGEA